MLMAAFKALGDLLSPEFRAVLLKALGLTLALFIAVLIVVEVLLTTLTHFSWPWADWVLGVGTGIALLIAFFFLMSPVTAAFAGLVYASRAGSVDPNAGRFVVLSAVAAAVIGGTSLFGGKGRIQDALIGGAVVAIIDNGMGLLGYPAGVKLMITGAVLMLAASADALSRKRSISTGK